tara:strand:+ start:84835 stop:84987 length:153 start_codon:yes stop_codon:yes gene_type:complete
MDVYNNQKNLLGGKDTIFNGVLSKWQLKISEICVLTLNVDFCTKCNYDKH